MDRGFEVKSSSNRSVAGGRFHRFVFSKKIDYVQLILGVAVLYFSFIFVFHNKLPEGATDDGKKLYRIDENMFSGDFDYSNEVRFEPLKILDKFRMDAEDSNADDSSRNVTRFGYKKPKLALVFEELSVDSYHTWMSTLVTILKEIGYEIEVFLLEDGPVGSLWRELSLPLNVISADENMTYREDWLNYHGIIVNSLGAVGVLPSLMQQPFKSVPLVWIIHEHTLSTRLKQYAASNQTKMVKSWRKVFQRATVVVFPDYYLSVAYSICDPGNYFVIPELPKAAWEAEKWMASSRNSFSIAIVGSQLPYRGLWLEHAFILQALFPAISNFMNSTSHLKIFILAGNSTSSYSQTAELIALSLKYPNGTVKLVAVDKYGDTVLSMAHLVIYGSFLEEHTFPEILLKAMCLGKPIVAPELPMIKKYVIDKVNGFLFPEDDKKVLTEIMFGLISNGKLTPLAQNAALIAKNTGKNLLVFESVVRLLEYILILPSEVATSRDIPREFTKGMWHQFVASRYANSPRYSGRINKSLGMVEKHLSRARKEGRFRRTWNEIHRNAKRDYQTVDKREGELLRTGQPLCIYEPFFGEGAWPFLHRTSLYRGFSLSTKGRRPRADDVDGPAQLSLLNNAYYRDILGEYGAFFAISNRIDRVHRNAWIGFQSWRATARSESLSKNAERSLLEAIEARRHGDALYFWARLDTDSRFQAGQDFWTFCDAINAGNCRFAFSEALKKMYRVRKNFSSLPEMPLDGGTWSLLHSWVVPTQSFMEFVMFSRMFVDALDAQFYEEHDKTGHCCLSISKDKHCYSRLLELLVNVWAYHSARRMVYIHSQTGSMQEQHELSGRSGRMWVKWFQFATLKSMDEDLAEEFDSNPPKERYLWPMTGEKFWLGKFQKLKGEDLKKQRIASLDLLKF